MPPALPPCGNPLFLSWVEELRDEAKAKGAKSAESYTKACNSIKRCPVVYSRPRELISLAAVGVKTVQILETRYKKYCLENGLTVPGSVEKKKGKRTAKEDDTSDLDGSEPTSPVLKKTRKPSNKPPKVYVPQKGSGGYGILLGLLMSIDQPERNTQVFLTKGELIRAAQPFCDTSYEHSEKGSYFNAWSSMKNLVGKGYVYVTGNPHKHCLTEEGYDVALVIRNLRPEFAHLSKYPFLHEPATDITHRAVPPLRPSLTQATTNSFSSEVGSSSKPKYYNPYPDDEETVNSQKGKNGRRPGLSSRVYSEDEDEVMLPGPSSRLEILKSAPSLGVQQSQPHSSKFEFWYIDSSGSRTSSLSSAMIRLDPVDFVNIRKLEFRSSQRSHPFVKQLKLVDEQPRMRDTSGQSTLFAFIVEEGAPPTCSKFSDLTTTLDPLHREHDIQSGHKRALSPTKLLTTLTDPNSTFDRTVSLPSAGAMRPLKSDLSATAGPSRSNSTSVIAGPSKPARQGPRLSSHIPTLNPLLDSFTDAASPIPLNPSASGKHFTFSPSEAIIFPAGSYEIILILDTREVESKTNRDKIAESLLAKGVKVETRALRLGDMCWVARRLDGLGGEEDECVLDYVVERKRLDDLCSSIKDGRYSEQCFRLSSSCINHVYYIVEDWQVAERMTYDGLAIMTAKSQLQITNRFFLKETHKLSETIDFLATMTSVIQSNHSSQDLHVIPTRHLSRASYSALQEYLRKTYPDRTYLTNFQAYQDLNDKSGSRTLREKFARMLLCVKGMSAERVSAVLEIWETPRDLWEALKEAENEAAAREGDESQTQVDSQSQSQATAGKGRKKAPVVRGPEMIFAEKVKGEGRRKIGDALSKDLYHALMG